MATSGSFTGSRTVTNGPQLHMSWSRLEVDIAGNRSKVRLTLQVYSQYSTYFSASKSGQLQGSNFTYSGGFSGTGYKTIQTKDFWVSHDSDGTKSFTGHGYFNINVSYSSGYVGQITVSGTISLDTIPRASNLNSFGIGSYLKQNTANNISLSLSRYSSSFTHSIYLKHGSTVIAYWTGQSLPTSLSITATEVNTLLNRLSSSTSATMTLVVQTYSGSTKIGSPVSRTATVNVSSTVTPTISSFSISIYGSGRDKVINKYVQNISKLAVSMSRTAGYGADLVSTETYVRRVSDKADSQTVNGTSGYTDKTFSLSGTYEAVAVVRDSRGATTTSTSTFTVEAYNVPRILNFGASRNVTTDTTVNITRNITYSPLAVGNNTLIIQVFRKPSNGLETNIQNTSTTSPTYTTGLTSTGNSVTLSYEFRLYITDSFGKTAESTQTISTAKVVLDIHQDLGVGIGKLHENGELDVRGEAFFEGKVNVGGQLKVDQIELSSALNGAVPAVWVKGNAREHAIRTRGIDGANADGTMGDLYINVNSDGKVYIGDAQDEIVASGSNVNGHWTRYYDGTQVCYTSDVNWSINNPSTAIGSLYRASSVIWTFPAQFSGFVFATAETEEYDHWCSTYDISASSCRFIEWSAQSGTVGQRKRAFAIGRWK